MSAKIPEGNRKRSAKPQNHPCNSLLSGNLHFQTVQDESRSWVSSRRQQKLKIQSLTPRRIWRSSRARERGRVREQRVVVGGPVSRRWA